MKLEGIINNTIFRNDENGYSVISVSSEDGDIVCVGIMPFFNDGEHIEAIGDIVYNDKYGEQFQVQEISVKKITGKESIIKFLYSSNIKGIGKKTAKDIYNKFKENSIDILYYRTDRLLEVDGIGRKKLIGIKESLEDNIKDRNSLIFLQGLDLTYNMSMKIIKAYGEDTEKFIRENPYQLIEDIRGIGFSQADKIANKLNIKNNSSFRISAAIIYILNYKSEQNGDVALDIDILISEVVNLINVDEKEVLSIIYNDSFKNKFVIVEIEDKKYIYLKKLYKAEKNVAFSLSSLIAEDNKRDIRFNLDNDYPNFSDEQKQAIRLAFYYNLLIITGGPGTGKTTIIKAIVDILESNDLTYYLCAPTGRAAKRMQESTQRESYTIHRLIGLNTDDFDSDKEQEQIDSDYIIVDEVSMVDIYLMSALLDAIKKDTTLILVGDKDQLPSVGPGNVLNDILNSSAKSIKLTKIYRQAQQSNIVVNAHKINSGNYPILNQKDKDFYFIDADPSNIDNIIANLVSKRLPDFYKLDPISDIQVLCPSKKTKAGVINLNTVLQQKLNPAGLKIDMDNQKFRLNDKVMQVRNNYDLKFFDDDYNYGEGIFNGDMGYILNVDNEEDIITVRFFDNKTVKYDKESIRDLDLSYAITIHKSQGSEFDAVIIPVSNTPYMLLNRNLLYTAITRAKKLVVLVGDKYNLKRMIDNNNNTNNRITNLTYRMEEFEEIHD